MQECAEGNLTEISSEEGDIFYNVMVPARISIHGNIKGRAVDFMVDTGSDKSMISYDTGCELGLEAPSGNDKIRAAKAANGQEMPYVIRKVDLQIGSISKKGISICWCLAPRVHLNFLGMDFLQDYKFIINGRTKKFYITRHNVCVKCRG